jgi:hypothetical protein
VKLIVMELCKEKKGPKWCKTDCLACAECWGMVFPEEVA